MHNNFSLICKSSRRSAPRGLRISFVSGSFSARRPQQTDTNRTQRHENRRVAKPTETLRWRTPSPEYLYSDHYKNSSCKTINTLFFCYKNPEQLDRSELRGQNGGSFYVSFLLAPLLVSRTLPETKCGEIYCKIFCNTIKTHTLYWSKWSLVGNLQLPVFDQVFQIKTKPQKWILLRCFSFNSQTLSSPSEL